MKTLFVRIVLKAGPEKFFRCGVVFTRNWCRVEVDKATAERLHGEQMLEVTDTEPEDFAIDEKPLDQAEIDALVAADTRAKSESYRKAAAEMRAKSEADLQAVMLLQDQAEADRNAAAVILDKAKTDAKVAADMLEKAEADTKAATSAKAKK